MLSKQYYAKHHSIPCKANSHRYSLRQFFADNKHAYMQWRHSSSSLHHRHMAAVVNRTVYNWTSPRQILLSHLAKLINFDSTVSVGTNIIQLSPVVHTFGVHDSELPKKSISTRWRQRVSVNFVGCVKFVVSSDTTSKLSYRPILCVCTVVTRQRPTRVWQFCRNRQSLRCSEYKRRCSHHNEPCIALLRHFRPQIPPLASGSLSCTVQAVHHMCTHPCLTESCLPR